jgi:N-acetylglucosaminyl-diphospho-decaprenol L-rhamnosyltransferase
MPTPVSLLVVNYRSAALAAGAIRSARQTTRHPLQVVVVDNSDEAEALRPFADVVISSEKNVGYAAAINRGRRACGGEVIVAANPDVLFAAGAIDTLVDADAAVAGPALFWDDAHDWLLPPAELHTPREIAARALATRSRGVARLRDRRRVLARAEFWSLQETTPVRALSGAVLAIKARAFDDAGGFDERFPLYFEENDFLRRVRGSIVYVPAARVRHLYNQSAAGSPEAAAMYARSEGEYLRKWGGAFWKKFERAPQAPWRTGTLACPPVIEDRQECLSSTETLVEASPLSDFETAAGHFPKRWPVALPAEVWSSYRGDALYLRVVRRDSGKVLAQTTCIPPTRPRTTKAPPAGRHGRQR